ncbi:MAG: hypothetical protein JWO31_103, partial [Phycisphaerales bacterium]|nr:hypothetical protein [Phycisphaerales bacterium]
AGSPRPARRRLGSAVLAVGLAVAVAAPTAFLARGSGLRTSVLRAVAPRFAAGHHPYVTVTRPGGEDGLVSCDAFVAADVALPNNGQVVDPTTVTLGSVRLVRRGDNTIVPARVNTSAAGDSIVLQPDHPLDPNTYYRFEVLPALKDTGGASFKPYRLGFTTGGGQPAVRMPVAFEQVPLPATAGHAFTGVTVGPDGRLYAATYDGSIYRYTLSAGGEVAGTETLNAVRAAHGGPRLVTGLCFAPESTAAAPVLYVTHGQCVHGTADEWTGKVGRLTGPALDRYEDVVTGLPRASRDHLTNQMAFGPDGALYVAQGSCTAMGAPDPAWGMRPERRLSACVLRVDLAKLAGGRPVDARTTDGGGSYDPDAAGAPVTVYASGIRNAYDLVWTRDGNLFAPVNGSAAGGNTPASPDGRVPALDNVRLTVPDHLLLVRPGGYHGHPNPSRGQYVLMGGNPAAEAGAVKITRYPVGTKPDPKWEPPVAEFGRNLSADGIIEYRGFGPTAALDGALFVCRYSGGKDVCVVVPNRDGTVREMITGIEGLTRFADPLDIAQDPTTGHLYVAEHGGKRITLVRARPGGESARVYRQPIATGHGPAAEPHPGSATVRVETDGNGSGD